jgi:glycosyltransferase involved in cell wall biosynthesis/SAM-dependent methyltransferase
MNNIYRKIGKRIRQFVAVARQSGIKTALSRTVKYISKRLDINFKNVYQNYQINCYSYNATKSILYISGEPETPGDTYRVRRYMMAAETNGWKAAYTTAEDFENHHFQAEDYSVVVIWRARWTPQLGEIIESLRSRGAKIVFDCDDLMVRPDLAKIEIIDGIRTGNFKESNVSDFYTSIRETMLAADFCFAPTEALALHMRLADKPTFVLHNGFGRDTHEFSRLARRKWLAQRTDTLIRIGYASGSLTHQRDFGLAVPALCEILRARPDCRLVLFRDPQTGAPLVEPAEFSQLQGLGEKIEWRNLQPLDNLPEELARFDINIAPLEFGNPFCEAKSELKFFEAALVDVPTVASPTEPFRKAIKHGETGFLAASADDWLFYLDKLLDDPSLRRDMGRNAYYSALARFGPLIRASRLCCVLDQLGEPSSAARAFALQAVLSQKKHQRPEVPPSKVVFKQDTLDKAEITVIIPLYNYEQYIEEALDSVKAQTLAAIDLIVVDGCSTDNSLSVALKWIQHNHHRFNRTLVLAHEHNYGLALCRNSGFDAAETEYIIPLDADNILLHECCKKLLNAANCMNSAYVYPQIHTFGENFYIMGTQLYSQQRFIFDNYIDAMALISKEAWAIVGGYQHIENGWEDYDFWCRLAENTMYGIHFPEVLARYRVHKKSMHLCKTNAAQKNLSLQKKFSNRHPWVSLRAVHLEQEVLSPTNYSKLTGKNELSRLDTLLPILRCPESREKLVFDKRRQKLFALDGLRCWPVVNGRPILASGIDTPRTMPQGHISNVLPQEALDIIHRAGELVLHLSAGGTEVKMENVVEVEYAVFRHTDIVADAHSLPFDDNIFAAVICMNAFEHYSNPAKVADELYRVLKPGGQIFLHTAFFQPLHEPPHHYYNTTRYGLEEWMKSFEIEELKVSDNFVPCYTLSWLASEAEAALRRDISDTAADNFSSASIGRFVNFWRRMESRNDALWTNFYRLSPTSQEILAAGFQFIGCKKEL